MKPGAVEAIRTDASETQAYPCDDEFANCPRNGTSVRVRGLALFTGRNFNVIARRIDK